MTDTRKIIAARLKELRKAKGWTVQQVSDKMGFSSHGRYTNWENEIRAPKYEQVEDLARIFNTTEAWIVGWAEHAGNSPDTLNLVAINKQRISVKDAILTLQNVANSGPLTLDYIKRRNLNEDKLTSILAPDNSMASLIEKGDELLLDQGCLTVSEPDVFAFLSNDRVWIRWIRPEMDGTYTLAAEDATHYPDQKLTAAKLDDLQIIGRVARICRDR